MVTGDPKDYTAFYDQIPCLCGRFTRLAKELKVRFDHKRGASLLRAKSQRRCRNLTSCSQLCIHCFLCVQILGQLPNSPRIPLTETLWLCWAWDFIFIVKGSVQKSTYTKMLNSLRIVKWAPMSPLSKARHWMFPMPGNPIVAPQDYNPFLLASRLFIPTTYYGTCCLSFFNWL